MILYFTATGNSKYTASKIAAACNDTIVSISDCMHNKKYSFSVYSNECLGIVSPVYYLGLPVIVCDFLDKLTVTAKENPYVYFIATYGTTPGGSGYFVNEYMKKKGYPINAEFGVKMPDTWTPFFNVNNKEKIKHINDKAEIQIDKIIEKIRNKTAGNFMHYRIPPLIAETAYSVYDIMRETKHFSVSNTCIGCGECAENCPVNAIEIQNAKPVWVKEKCVICLGCLHRCPEFAIQYGKNTKKHGQYINPNVKL